MRIASVFSYYGGKSKIIKSYPPPKHRQIIEPFAGAAAYAWAYHDHDVWLNDLDSRTFAIWSFLTSADALRKVRFYVPRKIRAGQKVSVIAADAPVGLQELMRSAANQGTQGAKGVHDQVTSMAETCWHRFRPKMEIVIPRIRHWRITNLDYNQIPNTRASWFVDPPYANPAGARYRQSTVNYPDLADWCYERLGQIIVCENAGATWLPFVSMNHRRVSIRSRYQKADAKEVVWVSEFNDT